MAVAESVELLGKVLECGRKLRKLNLVLENLEKLGKAVELGGM